MNDRLLPNDPGTSGQAPSNESRQQLENILRTSPLDAKVIFGAVRGTFDLNRHQVESFFHLVDQRVREQNQPSASTCEVAVYYSDGSSRRFPSIESFQGYAETRNRFPTVVTVHLDYLIQFPQGEKPERQEIDITIRASGTISETLEMVETDTRVRASGDKIQVAVSNSNSNLGVISYSINHSRISWGLDIEGHLKSNIEKLLCEPSKWDVFLRKIAGPLNLFTTVFVGLYCTNLIIDGFFNFLYQSDGAVTTDEVLNQAAEYLVNGQIAKYITASLVVSAVFFIYFASLVSRLTTSLKQYQPSFIVLDDGDLAKRKQRIRIFNRRWTKLLATISLDVLVAVFLFFLEDRIGQFGWFS